MSKMGYLLTHKCLLILFLMTSTVLMLSWFLVLKSSSSSRSVDFSILPNSKLMSNDINRNSRICDSNEVLKVFMYNLPPEFHFRLLGWKGKNGKRLWPDVRVEVPEYPGGLNLQHSIEYWLTLDLLRPESGGSALRVYNSSEADVIFVPFFASISYNRFKSKKSEKKTSVNELLQESLVKFLTAQEEWKRSGGKDHVIVAHHPNSLLEARTKLWPAIYILADFGRYPDTIANVDKDVIAPYKHIISNYLNDSSSFDSRRTLLYFQGAIYRKAGGTVRQELYYKLKEEKDVHFSFGSVQKDGIERAMEGMRNSKYCLNIAGDTPSSNRLFDAIVSHCVPVIISDFIELPYEDVLDYSEFCIFVSTHNAVKEKFLLNLLRNISKEEWTKKWKRLQEVERFYEFQFPSQENDAVQMIWQAIRRKVPLIKLKIHHTRRYSRTGVPEEKRLASAHLPRNFG